MFNKWAMVANEHHLKHQHVNLSEKDKLHHCHHQQRITCSGMSTMTKRPTEVLVF